MAEETTQQKPSSAKTYWLWTWLGPLGFVAVAAWLAFSGVKGFDIAPVYCGMVVGALWIIWAFVHWIDASPELLQPDEFARLDKVMLDTWFARYLQAAFMLCIAAGVIQWKEKLWWISVAYVIWAAIRAYEILGLLIVAAIGYAAFLGLASLPVSGAIIVGACIIAYAISASRKK